MKVLHPAKVLRRIKVLQTRKMLQVVDGDAGEDGMYAVHATGPRCYIFWKCYMMAAIAASFQQPAAS